MQVVFKILIVPIIIVQVLIGLKLKVSNVCLVILQRMEILLYAIMRNVPKIVNVLPIYVLTAFALQSVGHLLINLRLLAGGKYC